MGSKYEAILKEKSQNINHNIFDGTSPSHEASNLKEGNKN